MHLKFDRAIFSGILLTQTLGPISTLYRRADGAQAAPRAVVTGTALSGSGEHKSQESRRWQCVH